jgi:hypothetical protein
VEYQRAVAEEIVLAAHGTPVDALGEVVDEVDARLVVGAVEGVVELGLLDVDRRVAQVLEAAGVVKVQVRQKHVGDVVAVKPMRRKAAVKRRVAV